MLARWRRRSPATLALAALLSLAQMQTSLAAIVNSAVASGTYGGAGVSSAPSTASVPVAAASPAVTVTKTETSSGYVRPGDVVTWDVTVQNTGNTVLSALTVSDPLTGTVTCASSGDATIASLAPGATETCTANYAVAASDIAAGSLANTATVDASAPDGGSLTASGSSTVNAIPANLVTVKSLASGNPAPGIGDIVEFSITVTNNGPADATAVSLTDGLPSGLTPSSSNGTVSAGAYDTGTGLWTVGALAAGATAILTLQGTVDTGQAGTAITNTTTPAQGTEYDPSGAGDVLSVTVTPASRTIDATDDTLSAPVDSAMALPGALNVLDNDTLAGSPAAPAYVTLSATGPLPAGFTLNPDGTLDIAQFTAPGIYAFEYRICEQADPANCDTATVTAEVECSLPAISGKVYLDANADGIFDVPDPVQPGYLVELVSGGIVYASIVSATDGSYRFEGFPAGTYTVRLVDPGMGMAIRQSAAIAVAQGDEVTGQNLPVDPSGVIYDSVSGDPLAGVGVEITDAGGTALPAACLLPGQQSQITASSGRYRFDLQPESAAACPAGKTEYRLKITPAAGYQPPPSVGIPPESSPLDPSVCLRDAVPGPPCSLSADSNAPPFSAPTPYYLAFLVASGDPDIVNNHIPLDPAPVPGSTAFSVVKAAGVRVAHRGDSVPYVIRITNNDLAAFAGLSVRDTLPPGFVFVPGSATLDGTAVTPLVSGQSLTFGPVDFAAGVTREFRLLTRIGASVAPGVHVNMAMVHDRAGLPASNQAKAAVRVDAEHAFDCGEVIGKVFDDSNGNGYQDEGEHGLPGVRIATVRGVLITTDAFGRYSVPCAELPDPKIGSNFILKIDPRTLPLGYRPTTENPRVVRLTRGKITTLNFGAAATRLARINLDARAFAADSADPNALLANAIAGLFTGESANAAALRLIYFRREEEPQRLVEERLAAVRNLVSREWHKAGGRGDLPFETVISGGN